MRTKSNGFTVLELLVSVCICALLLGALLGARMYVSDNHRLVSSQANQLKRVCEFAYQQALESGKRTTVCVDQKTHRVLVQTWEGECEEREPAAITSFALNRVVSIEAGPADGPKFDGEWVTTICAFGEKTAAPARRVRLWDATGHELFFTLDSGSGRLRAWHPSQNRTTEGGGA